MELALIFSPESGAFPRGDTSVFRRIVTANRILPARFSKVVFSHKVVRLAVAPRPSFQCCGIRNNKNRFGYSDERKFR